MSRLGCLTFAIVRGSKEKAWICFHLGKEIGSDVEVLEVGTLPDENELLWMQIGIVLQVELPEVDAEFDVL